MERDWARLGRAMQAGRKAQDLTQADVAKLAGVSVGTIAAIERGQEFKSVTPSMRVISRLYGWGNGSIEAVLEGGDPLPVNDVAPAAPVQPAVGEGLPLRVARALTEGTTLDTTIIPIGASAEMVVVVKGRPSATPQQLTAALLDWEKRGGFLERLGEVADDPSDSQ